MESTTNCCRTECSRWRLGSGHQSICRGHHRFRLLVAAVNAWDQEVAYTELFLDATLATGDSLLWVAGQASVRAGAILRQGNLIELDPIYAVEILPSSRGIGQGYHVVVATRRTSRLRIRQNEEYRNLYSTCHRQYSLGVPFTSDFGSWRSVRASELAKKVKM